MKQISPPQTWSGTSKETAGLSEDERGMDLREYWYVIYRYRYIVLACPILAFFFAAISVPWGPPLYTARTTLYLQGHTQAIFGGAEPVPVRTLTGYYDTQRQLLMSRSLIAQVIKELRLDKDPRFRAPEQSPLSRVAGRVWQQARTVQSWLQEWIKTRVGLVSEQPPPARITQFEFGVHPGLVGRYMNALTIQSLPNSQLMQLSFQSSDPALSQRVINAHARAFLDRNLETRFELTTETRQFLEKKLAELRVNVERSEQELNRFQRDHEIVSLDKGSSLVLDQLKRLNTDLTSARSKRIELETLHRLVRNRDNRLLSQIIDNPTIQQLRRQLSDLEVQLDQLSTKFKPTYRGIIALHHQMDEARSRMDQEINRIVLTIERDFQAAVATENALTSEAENARRTALELQERAVEYAVLEREVASNRALYESVFKKTKEAALTGDEPMPNLRIVDRAEIPVSPDTTKTDRILLLALAFGLFGGTSLAFLLHMLDNTVRTPEDVERFVRLPTLGIAPDIHRLASNGQRQLLGYTPKLPPPHSRNGQRRANNQPIVGHHPLSLMGEMYRTICTAILFSKPDHPPQTILVTSSQPNEGKTITAINIAMMLAQSGEPVLLVDADLRGGRCHHLLSCSNGKGLTNVLTGGADALAQLKKTNVKNLSLLCRGVTPPNPADLLASDKMRQTLDSLSVHFRFIVLDSAPLLPVSDTVLLSTKADGVILVIRGQEVTRNVVRKARERLEYVNAKIIGVVLNGIDISSAEYREYKYIHQSYYSRYAEASTVATPNGDGPYSVKGGDGAPANVSATISPEFMERIIAKYAEFVGPMGSTIVQDHIAALGESRDVFPHSHLADLIDALAAEISNETLRATFRDEISEEIRKANVDGSHGKS